MAHYIVNFTRAGTTRHRGMPDQARELLKLGLWGVPSTAQLRMKLRPGDGVLVAVGAPDRVFVADAVVRSGYHRFSEEDATRLPDTVGFDHGITLTRVRVWPGAVRVMAIWSRTTAARTNPAALWLGAITTLRSADAAMIVAAGSAGQPQRVAEQPESAEPSLRYRTGSARRTSVKRGSVRRDDAESHAASAGVRSAGAGLAAPGPAVRPAMEPRVAIDLAARALKAAQRSPSWLPTRIAHADWGTAAAKRVVATAELLAGVYRARPPGIVTQTGGLIERMGLRDARGESTLLGFDFPIGLPRAYAHSAGIESFADWFRALGLGSTFFEVAADVAEVSTARPFFPTSISEKTPGIKELFHESLGISGANALRSCERAHCARRAASEMFWALGPQAVGKATLAGWKEALRPALAEQGRSYSLWPFDGALPDLLGESDAVIVETYPAEAYRQLDLRMGKPGTAKTRQDDRRADARRILESCAENAVIPDEELTTQLLDGFGQTPAGEDPFDAVVGLLGMIDTVRRRPEPELPDDPAVGRLEGWMFGQHAVCPPAAPTPSPRQ